MKVNIGILCFGIILNWAELNAQPNLVPNPSFEIQDTCPSFQNRICDAVPWFQPHKNTNGVCLGSSSTDYYHQCATWLVGVPVNFQGYQYARTGDAYVGIIVREDSNDTGYTLNYREYLEVGLTDTLIQGKKYCVTFYVSHADTNNIAIASLGAFFSNDSLLSTDYNFIPVTPQITNSTGFLTEETNWIEVSGIYTAVGGERYITIGNFIDDANTPYEQINTNPGQRHAYYYIDDVSVIEMADSSSACGNVGVEEIKLKKEASIYPNPARDKLAITSKQFAIENIEIFNLLGEKVLSQYESGSQQMILVDISSLQNGVYFIHLKGTSKTHVERFVILH